MCGDDGGQARMIGQHRFDPAQNFITGLHFQRNVQEAVSAGREFLRAIGATLVACNIPGLVPEETGVVAEHAAKEFAPTFLRSRL